MEECIRDLNTKLHLTDKEAVGLVITHNATEKAMRDGSLCLVGKLFANRFVGGEVVIEAMRKAWMLGEKVDFKSVGGNIFFFQFDSKEDMLRVKNGGPWHVDRNLLALEPFDGRLAPTEYMFRYVEFWIHVVDPPLMLMTKECAKQIGNQVGSFIEWDKGTNRIVWGRRMRIRVKVPIDQPLMRGIKVILGNGEERWLKLTYEKLPYFCYTCGMIGHRYLDCGERKDKENDSDSEDLPYPKSLMATPYKRNMLQPMDKEGSGFSAFDRCSSKGEKEVARGLKGKEKETGSALPQSGEEIMEVSSLGNKLVPNENLNLNPDSTPLIKEGNSLIRQVSCEHKDESPRCVGSDDFNHDSQVVNCNSLTRLLPRGIRDKSPMCMGGDVLSHDSPAVKCNNLEGNKVIVERDSTRVSGLVSNENTVHGPGHILDDGSGLFDVTVIEERKAPKGVPSNKGGAKWKRKVRAAKEKDAYGNKRGSVKRKGEVNKELDERNKLQRHDWVDSTSKRVLSASETGALYVAEDGEAVLFSNALSNPTVADVPRGAE